MPESAPCGWSRRFAWPKVKRVFGEFGRGQFSWGTHRGTAYVLPVIAFEPSWVGSTIIRRRSSRADESAALAALQLSRSRHAGVSDQRCGGTRRRAVPQSGSRRYPFLGRAVSIPGDARPRAVETLINCRWLSEFTNYPDVAPVHAKTNPRKSRCWKTSSGISSGCHWTATRKRSRQSSEASITPSGLRATIVRSRPGRSALTA